MSQEQRAITWSNLDQESNATRYHWAVIHYVQQIITQSTVLNNYFNLPQLYWGQQMVETIYPKNLGKIFAQDNLFAMTRK